MRVQGFAFVHFCPHVFDFLSTFVDSVSSTTDTSLGASLVSSQEFQEKAAIFSLLTNGILIARRFFHLFEWSAVQAQLPSRVSYA
jgi:hypothetical protein